MPVAQHKSYQSTSIQNTKGKSFQPSIASGKKKDYYDFLPRNFLSVTPIMTVAVILLLILFIADRSATETLT